MVGSPAQAGAAAASRAPTTRPKAEARMRAATVAVCPASGGAWGALPSRPMATPLRPPPAPAEPVAPLRWDRERLTVLDQTALPAEERWLTLSGAGDVADAIRRLAVRGAPLIGIAAGYGMAMEAARGPECLDRAAELLRTARPTAVNLGWAIARVHAAARAGGAAAARAEAERIHAEDEAASAAMAAHGAALLTG